MSVVPPSTSISASSASIPGKPHSVSGGYRGFGTAAIHAGQNPDPVTGAVIPPISLSSTFAQKSPGETYMGYEYSRSANPNRDAFEKNVAALESADHCVAFGSGLAATSGVIHILPQNSHIICIDDVYGGTQRYFRRIAVNYGHEFEFIDFSDLELVEKTFRENTKLVWMETPTNPTLKIADIAAIAEIAHKHGAWLLVDNTFCSPYFQQPLTLGADMVLHSVTKYLNGHSDVVMGLVCLSDPDLLKNLRFVQNSMGAVPSPFDCFLANRGLKTLHIRMRAHEQNAMRIATLLEGHPKVDKVVYPGLKSHPQHDIACKQMYGFGGMITFFVNGGIDESRRFLENLRIFTLAESLGGVESLAEHPAIMTHASVPPEHRALLGIDDRLVRLSVGIEDIEDLENDILNALEAA